MLTILSVDSELLGDLVEVGSTDEGNRAFLPQILQHLEHLFRRLLSVRVQFGQSARHIPSVCNLPDEPG